MFIKSKRKARAATEEEGFQLACEAINGIIDGSDGFSIQRSTTLEELGFDSIKFIHLVLNLEEIIDNKLEDIVDKLDFSSLLTVNDLAKVIIGLIR